MQEAPGHRLTPGTALQVRQKRATGRLVTLELFFQAPPTLATAPRRISRILHACGRRHTFPHTFFKGKQFLTPVQGSGSLVAQCSTGHVSLVGFDRIPVLLPEEKGAAGSPVPLERVLHASSTLGEI